MGSLTRSFAIFAVLLSGGCAHRPRTYAATDEFFASGQFPVPREFRRGTATLPDVYAWSSALLNWDESVRYPPLQSLEVDVDGDTVAELFISQRAHAGNGGISYLVFQRRGSGFRYLGSLAFSGIRPAPKDIQGRCRVVTTWRLGAGTIGVTLWAVTPEGFRKVAARELAAGDSGTEEGNRLAALLFESGAVTEDALQTVFGPNFEAHSEL